MRRCWDEGAGSVREATGLLLGADRGRQAPRLLRAWAAPQAPPWLPLANACGDGPSQAPHGPAEEGAAGRDSGLLNCTGPSKRRPAPGISWEWAPEQGRPWKVLAPLTRRRGLEAQRLGLGSHCPLVPGTGSSVGFTFSRDLLTGRGEGGQGMVG